MRTTPRRWTATGAGGGGLLGSDRSASPYRRAKRKRDVACRICRRDALACGRPVHGDGAPGSTTQPAGIGTLEPRSGAADHSSIHRSPRRHEPLPFEVRQGAAEDALVVRELLGRPDVTRNELLPAQVEDGVVHPGVRLAAGRPSRPSEQQRRAARRENGWLSLSSTETRSNVSSRPDVAQSAGSPWRDAAIDSQRNAGGAGSLDPRSKRRRSAIPRAGAERCLSPRSAAAAPA